MLFFKRRWAVSLSLQLPAAARPRRAASRAGRACPGSRGCQVPGFLILCHANFGHGGTNLDAGSPVSQPSLQRDFLYQGCRVGRIFHAGFCYRYLKVGPDQDRAPTAQMQPQSTQLLHRSFAAAAGLGARRGVRIRAEMPQASQQPQRCPQG